MAFIGTGFDEMDQALLGCDEYGLDEDGFSVLHHKEEDEPQVTPKLLSVVLGSVPGWYTHIHIPDASDVMWTTPETVSGRNLYELANECKLWMLNNRFKIKIESSVAKNKVTLSFEETLPGYDRFASRSKEFKWFKSEPYAVLEATKWAIKYIERESGNET